MLFNWTRKLVVWFVLTKVAFAQSETRLSALNIYAVDTHLLDRYSDYIQEFGKYPTIESISDTELLQKFNNFAASELYIDGFNDGSSGYKLKHTIFSDLSTDERTALLFSNKCDDNPSLLIIDSDFDRSQPLNIPLRMGVANDFFLYSNGVYQCRPQSTPVGYQSVALIAVNENEIIIENSQFDNADWGLDDNTMRIAIDSIESCQIEYECASSADTRLAAQRSSVNTDSDSEVETKDLSAGLVIMIVLSAIVVGISIPIITFFLCFQCLRWLQYKTQSYVTTNNRTVLVSHNHGNSRAAHIGTNSDTETVNGENAHMHHNVEVFDAQLPVYGSTMIMGI